MPVLPRLFVTFTLLALFLPSVTADQCNPNEFWYETKSCCLPHNPPQSNSSPPSGKSCPSSNTHNWYWSDEKSCCLPTAPPPQGKPTPTCINGYAWNERDSCCSALPSTPGGPGPDDCSDEEFWYQTKSCCLPHGGPPNPPSPPTGSDCPPFGWYWGHPFDCCIPYHPSPPPPSCPPGWEWSTWRQKCRPISTPPSSDPPQPSYRHGDNGWKKRSQKLRTDDLCPFGMTACPIVGAHGVFSDYDCFDITQELQSCGGCSSTGAGRDCTAIRGAWNVGCEAGHCTVYNCMSGYKLASNGATCIRL